MLDTFLYADKQLMQAFPDLLRAKVYVHFQSDVQVGHSGGLLCLQQRRPSHFVSSRVTASISTHPSHWCSL